MFVIRMLNPKREQFYFPAILADGLARDRQDAAAFKTEQAARRRLTNHISPPAFWESEQAHRRAMLRRFRGWQYFYEAA